MHSDFDFASETPRTATASFHAANNDTFGCAQTASPSPLGNTQTDGSFLVTGPSRNDLVDRLRGASFAARSVVGLNALSRTLCPQTHSGVIVDLSGACPEDISCLTARVRARRRATGLLCLTNDTRVSDAISIMRAGAFDILPIAVSDMTFFSAVHSIAERYRLWRHRVLEIHDYKRDLEKLSRRERQVYDLMLECLKTREIAGEIGISPRTVDIFRASIGKKMKRRTLAHLLRLSILKEEYKITGQVGIPDPNWWHAAD